MKKLKKGDVIVVKHILGETAVPLLESLGGGKYRFKADAWCEGESCKGGFFHLRQAIEVKPGKKITNTVNFWPRLRAALRKAGIRPVNVPGGNNPLHYSEQMAVADFSMSGAHYFIVERTDIGKYLATLPLDDHGRKHRQLIERQKAEAESRKKELEAESYRQEHDPQCIAKRIGEALNNVRNSGVLAGENKEFTRITLVAGNGSNFSIIYPAWDTDLIYLDSCNVAKVVCSAPEETGLEYLDARIAGSIDPRQHYRIKKIYSPGWGRYSAYLMPLPGLATETRETYLWQAMFDTDNNDGVDPRLIAGASKVILETFDLYDHLNKKRLVYEADTRKVHVEYLHNEPQNWFDQSKLSKAPEWGKE